jgi:hypothetical protein
MKTHKGFKIATEPDQDIGILRHSEFRKAYSMLIFGIYEFDFIRFVASYNDANDNDKKIIVNNFIQGCLIEKQNYNAYLECFKLICNEENENIHKIDNDLLNEKLIRISEAGFSEKEIKDFVENFSDASPTLRNLKQMRSLAMLNFSKLTKK